MTEALQTEALQMARELPGLDIPEGFFVYFLWGQDGSLVYVGQTGSLLYRVAQHLQDKVFTRITFMQYASRGQAKKAERELIRELDPPLNRLLRPRARRALPMFPCAHCGQEFTPSRSDARFCSGRCRVAAHRARGLSGSAITALVKG
jgi:hypothetical protein